MAIVNLPPAAAAKQQQQASRALRLQSIDPVERYKAREEQIAEAAREYSGELLRQAERNRKAQEAQERAYDRIEREHQKYRPLPPGAKVTER